MSIEKFSQLMHNISDQNHPHFLIGQAALVSVLSYTGTAIVHLTGMITTTAFQGSAYVMVAFSIYHLSTRWFAEIFKSAVKEPLIMQAYSYVKWTFALYSSKIICRLFGLSLSLSQIVWIGIGFFIAMRIAKEITKQLRQKDKLPDYSSIPMRS